MLRKTIATALVVGLITGCADFLSATRDEPISEDPASRTLGTIIDDERLEIRTEVNISEASQVLENSHISAVSFNGRLLLVGQVPTLEAKKQAESIARQESKVKDVYNQLTIAGPTTILVRTNDTSITTRVKTALVTDSSTSDLYVKVVTEDGVVYLMGLLTVDQAERAVNVVSTVSGIKRIVKVFEYI